MFQAKGFQGSWSKFHGCWALAEFLKCHKNKTVDKVLLQLVFDFNAGLISPSTSQLTIPTEILANIRLSGWLTWSHGFPNLFIEGPTQWVCFLRYCVDAQHDCLKGGQPFEVTSFHLYLCWLAIGGRNMFGCTAEGLAKGPETPASLWGVKSTQPIIVVYIFSYVSAGSVLTGNFKESNLPPAYIMGFCTHCGEFIMTHPVLGCNSTSASASASACPSGFQH